MWRGVSAAKALQQRGEIPPESQHPEAYRVRPIETILPRGVDIEEGAAAAMRGTPLAQVQ